MVLSAVGTGFISFGLWVHHMFTTGLPSISLGFFSAASEAVVIPTGIQIFAFLATLLVGKVKRSLPMLWIAGALTVFIIGGLTGVMLAIAPFDFQVHDTYFIVAHLHYTLFGGLIFPVIAGVYYFFPFFRKKMLSERLGRWAFWLIFSGFNLCFLPMHLTGLLGMPRRVYTYPTGLGLGRAQHDLDRGRLRHRRRLRGLRLGHDPAQDEPAADRAQPVGRRHAGMGA